MTTGQPRRTAPQDRLAGHAGVEPLTLQGPGLSSPPAIRAPDLTQQQRIASQLAEWGGGKLEAAVNKQHEKDILAGQMAYQQGKTFDEVQMGGNKWALEGYRLIDAQTTASSLLAAQREQIAQTDHALSPEDFRAQYVSRLDAALEGVDPRTARLVREQMVAQMPTLVADHTAQNLVYQEGKAFEAMERSVDVVSRDPTGTEALILFAKGGEDSPSAGLSDDRRQAATVAGVIRAFDNDNPLAYAALAREGLLGDNLTTDEQNAIKGAQQRFEQRRRTEYNEELLTGEKSLMTSVENGELSPTQAAEELNLLYAEHGIKMTQDEAGVMYDAAKGGQETANKTASILIEDAVLRGDFTTVARLSARALPGLAGNALPDTAGAPADWSAIRAGIFKGESGGDYDALFGFSNRDGGKFANVRLTEMTVDEALAFASPNGEYGQWTKGQVGRVATPMGAYQIVGTTLRAAKKGLGLSGDEVMTPELQERLGVWIYNQQGTGAWEGYQGKQSGGTSVIAMSDAEMAEWSALVTQHNGDVAAAAVERKFGFAAAATYALGKGSDEVMAYANGVKTNLDNWRAPTAADKQAVAQERLQTTRERLALDTYEQTEPKLRDVDGRFERGEIDRSTWKAERETIYSEYGRARERADVEHEIATVRRAEEYQNGTDKQRRDDQYQLSLEAANATLAASKLAWSEVVDNPASSTEEKKAATQQYLSERTAVYDDHGIKAIDRNDGPEVENIVKQMKTSMDNSKVYMEQEAEINAAIAGGYVSELPKDLQARAFKKVQEGTQKTYNDAVASGQLSEDAANTLMARDMNVSFAKMGVVDPAVARRAGANLRRAWVDKDGNPDPLVVDTITQWAELKALNPRAADTMLSGEELAKAEAALSRTGGDPALMGEAVRDMGIDLSKSPLVTDTREFIARQDVQDSMNAAVDSFLETQDIGMFQAMFSDRADYDQTYDRGYTATDRMYNDENRARVNGEISEELSRLHRQNPGMKPADLVARAAENVERRTQTIGGDVVVLPTNKDFGKMFFGSRANEFSHDGDINSAVMEYLRDPGVQEQYPYLTGTTFSENLPGWVQGGIDIIPGIEFQPAMSWTEAGDTQDTGIRPFRAFPTAQGEVAIQVLLPDGSYSLEPIVIDAKKAGDLYMKKKRSQIIAEPQAPSVTPSFGGFGGIPMP